MSARNGFTLVELIVVMSIIAIVLGVAALNFSSMQKKYYIEKVANDLMADVYDLRMKAMTRKEEHSITLNSNSYVLSRGAIPFATRSVESGLADKNMVPFSGATVITFDERGFTGGGDLFGQTIVVGPVNNEASINCVVISNARINMGKMNGTTCEFK